MPTLSLSWEEYPFPPHLVAELLLILQILIQTWLCEDSYVSTILISSCYYTRYHTLGDRKNGNLFLNFLGWEVQDQGAGLFTSWWGLSSLRADGRPLAVLSLEKRELSHISSTKGTNLNVRLPASWSNYLLVVLPANTVTLGVRVQHTNSKERQLNPQYLPNWRSHFLYCVC